MLSILTTLWHYSKKGSFTFEEMTLDGSIKRYKPIIYD